MIEESTGFREAALAGRLGYLNAGAGPATLHVYGHARAANIGTAPGAAALCVITLADPAGTVSAGVLALAQAADGLIDASGNAVWCRVFNGDGAACFDMDAGVTDSGAEAVFATTTLYAGGALRLLSCALG